MTDFMKQATKGEAQYENKVEIFERVIKLLHPIGRAALRGKNGQFSTSLYDGIFNGVASNIEYYESSNVAKLKSKIDALKGDDEFKKVSGVASNYKERVKKRITRALEIFSRDE